MKPQEMKLDRVPVPGQDRERLLVEKGSWGSVDRYLDKEEGRIYEVSFRATPEMFEPVSRRYAVHRGNTCNLITLGT